MGGYRYRGALFGVALAALAIGPALAAGDATEAELARAHIAEPFEVQTEGPSDYVVRQMTVEPGWSSGWHSHPGLVLVAVTAGELTLYEERDQSCATQVLRPGQGAAETGGKVMLARNEGDAPAEVYVSYVVPAGGPLGQEEAAPESCAS